MTRWDEAVAPLAVPEKPEDTKLTVRQLMAKARSMTRDVEESSALQALGKEEESWRSLSAVLPPYDPESLLKYVEITPHIKPCIDSLGQNVDGYGYKAIPIEPWLDDPNDEEVLNKITEALRVERWVEEQELALAESEETGIIEERLKQLREKGASPRTLRRYKRRLSLIRRKGVAEERDGEATVGAQEEELLVPGETEEQDEQIAEEAVADEAVEILANIRTQLATEKHVFNAFFEHCCSDRSFVELRKAVRSDYESHGWGTIEWLRDKWGRLRRLAYVPAYTVRPVIDQGEMVAYEEDDSITPLSEGRTTIVHRRFPVYVQQVGSERVYFKSAGDPRVVSRKTGKTYKSIEELRAEPEAKPPGEGKDAVPANELMWFAKHDPTTPCPPPDWIGNLLSVLGGREADETNYFFLNNSAIPSGMLFVHGGTVPRATKERLEHRLTHEVGGAKNAGRILVVEARPGGRAAPGEKAMQPELTFQSLREAQNTDSMFTVYDQRGCDRIGASFRLSPMLRGYTPTSLNRATAYAAIAFAEQQVFSPLRQAFDWTVNKFIIPEIGVKLLKFVSNAPPTTTTEELSGFISAVAPHGAFIPTELREIASDALARDMRRIDEDWTTRPLQLTLNGIGGTQPGAAPGEAAQTLGEINARLRQIETKVAQIVTAELRSIGLEYDVVARHVDEGADDGGKQED